MTEKDNARAGKSHREGEMEGLCRLKARDTVLPEGRLDQRRYQ